MAVNQVPKAGVDGHQTEVRNAGTALVLLSTEYGAEVSKEIPHVRYFPERAMTYLHLARDFERVIIVLPESIDDTAVNYFFDAFFHPHERAEIEQRVEILPIKNGPEGALSQRFISDGASMEKLRALIGDKRPLKIINAATYSYDAELSSILGGQLEERKLEVARKIGTKFGSKSLFNWTCVSQPDWQPRRLTTQDGVLQAMKELFEKHKKICVKIDDHAMAGGIGNFYFSCPPTDTTLDAENAVDYLVDTIQPFSKFWGLVERSGCIVESYVEDAAAFPSALMTISNDGKCIMESWQYQFIKGSHFSGFDILPSPRLTATIERMADHICKTAYQLGYTGSLGIDFIATSDDEVMALELNARKTGVSHVIQFCDGVLRKHGRSRDQSAVISYRRGIFATAPEHRSFEANVSKLSMINSGENAQEGDGCYFINVNSLGLNGFVEYICIASSREQLGSMEAKMQKLFEPDPLAIDDTTQSALWHTLGAAI